MTSRVMLIAGLSLLVLSVTTQTMFASEPDTAPIDVDWPSYLEPYNYHWDTLPQRWLDAPFLGNGMMGTMVFQTGEQTMQFQVGRGDVHDHRPMEFEGRPVGTMFTRNRLPIGSFELQTVGNITGGSMELDLYNAEASGVIETDQGSIAWRAFVPTDHMVILAEIDPQGGEAECQWVWKPEPAISPRQLFREGNFQDWYVNNPDPVISQSDDITLCTQPLLHGGETVTAWKEQARGDKRMLIVSVAHQFPEKNAAEEAITEIREVEPIATEALIEAHRAWWHEFWPESFVSIPDPYWQQFYWMQMYKLASATRGDRMLLDLNGPWLQRTPWPGTWWNLNTQLSYWPTYGSNRLHLGESLNRHIYQGAEQLSENVPESCRHDSAALSRATGHDLAGSVALPNGQNAPEAGLLLWTLHNCWLHYRHRMDDQELRDDLYPLLKRAVNFYFHFLIEDENGVLHIPQTISPEYKHGRGPNTNFDLALLRWACQTLIDSAERLDIDDPLVPRWKNVIENLAPYQIDENGFMIAENVPFAHRHRHFSHLLMMYPLYLVNADQEGSEELAVKSIRHWLSFGPWHGYAFTGSSSLMSGFGHGDEALKNLNGLQDKVSRTTMYSEIGPWAQCIETPLSAAQSIHDMLLQSWGGTIRVFPAVPTAWADVAFHDMRTEGAFLISAVHEDGETKWVRIESLAGEPCRIQVTMPDPVKVTGSRSFDLQKVGEATYTLDLKQGEIAWIYSGDMPTSFKVKPVKPAATKE